RGPGCGGGRTPVPAHRGPRRDRRAWTRGLPGARRRARLRPPPVRPRVPATPAVPGVHGGPGAPSSREGERSGRRSGEPTAHLPAGRTRTPARGDRVVRG